jgi:hypothetical protein
VSRRCNQGDELGELGTKLVNFAIVYLEEEKSFGFLRETLGSVKGYFFACS